MRETSAENVKRHNQTRETAPHAHAQETSSSAACSPFPASLNFEQRIHFALLRPGVDLPFNSSPAQHHSKVSTCKRTQHTPQVHQQNEAFCH
jgi:hypothetical protein